jgi:hypothetical protein
MMESDPGVGADPGLREKCRVIGYTGIGGDGSVTPVGSRSPTSGGAASRGGSTRKNTGDCPTGLRTVRTSPKPHQHKINRSAGEAPSRPQMSSNTNAMTRQRSGLRVRSGPRNARTCSARRRASIGLKSVACPVKDPTSSGGPYLGSGEA